LFGFAGNWKRDRPTRLKRLADTIDALVEKDNRTIEQSRLVEDRRAKASVELHEIFRDFVARVNALASKAALTLDPDEFDSSQFMDSDENCFQIHVRGRILLVTFGPPGEPISTEDFPEPYVLHGTARCFNQDFLEHESIEEHRLFYCMEGRNPGWRFVMPRTYQSGPLDENYLASVFEMLL
jgi:hypothetical protein